jgi:hypothetical protein
VIKRHLTEIRKERLDIKQEPIDVEKNLGIVD